VDRDADRSRRSGTAPERPIARQHVVKSRRNAETDRLADVVQRTSIEMGATDRPPNDSPATQTPGRELAFARSRLSLSLEEIARRTKIGVPYLLAIENDDLSKLPGSFYARGFLRAYAREVHCDPEDIVRRFGITAEEPSPADLQPLSEALHVHAPIDLDGRRTARRIQMLALAALVAGSFYVASGKPLHLSMPRPSIPKPVVPDAQVLPNVDPPPAVAPPPVVATAGAAPSEAKPSASAAPLSIDVQSRAECWLTATADGERVIYRLLSAGESAHIEAQQDIVLRVGDAAAMAFAINGATGKTLGAAGEAVTIHVTPTNYREFLTSRPSTDPSSAGT